MGSFIHYTLSGGIFAFAHIRTLLNASFICNFLSFSAGFNLCSCFFRLTFDFRFHFRLSLGLTFHDQLPLPANFLTPAVFAFFRPLQFWVLTTQPLFLPFPFFTVSPHSGFPAAGSHLSVPSVSRSDLPGFPCFSFRSSTWLSVCFLSSFLASLPQPFRKCSLCSSLTGFRFSVFPSPIRFSFASFPVLTTQPSVLLFPSSLSSLTVAVQVLTYLRSLPHFSCFRSHFGTQPCCNSFLLRLFRFTAAIQPFILSFRLSDVPLAFALGSGYSAGRCTLKTEHRYSYML